MTTSPATVQDVARLAGVSAMTVSRVLNDRKGRFTEDTRARVLQAAQKLNYQHNRAARAMRLNQTFCVSLTVDGSTQSSFLRDPGELSIGTILPAIMYALEQRGYTLTLTPPQITPGQPSTNLLVDATIYFPTTRNLTALADSAGPVRIVIDQPQLDLPSISIDYRAGLIEAVEHLRTRGRSRIAFVGGPRELDVYHNTERYAGYVDGLQACGLPQAPELIFSSDFSFEGGRTVFDEVMQAQPDAIIAATDRSAIGLIRAARARGLSIPTDLAIVGFDDLESAQYVDPPLTTIHNPLMDLGLRVAELTVAAIERTLDPEHRHIRLPTHLVVRESS